MDITIAQRPDQPPAAIAPPREPMVVNCAAYDRHGRRLPGITLDQISDVLAEPDTFVWVGVHEPDEPLLEKLQEEFDLHDLAVEDADRKSVV